MIYFFRWIIYIYPVPFCFWCFVACLCASADKFECASMPGPAEKRKRYISPTVNRFHPMRTSARCVCVCVQKSQTENIFLSFHSHFYTYILFYLFFRGPHLPITAAETINMKATIRCISNYFQKETKSNVRQKNSARSKILIKINIGSKMASWFVVSKLYFV